MSLSFSVELSKTDTEVEQRVAKHVLCGATTVDAWYTHDPPLQN
jgi:hypothetical protein